MRFQAPHGHSYSFSPFWCRLSSRGEGRGKRAHPRHTAGSSDAVVDDGSSSMRVSTSVREFAAYPHVKGSGR